MATMLYHTKVPFSVQDADPQWRELPNCHNFDWGALKSRAESDLHPSCKVRLETQAFTKFNIS